MTGPNPDDSAGVTLAEIVAEGLPELLATYGGQLSHDQQRALQAIRVCRTAACGSLLMRCSACGQRRLLPRVCGHRSCPACQHHTTSQWLDRQMSKRLPVDYFMVTLTLPADLRGVAAGHPKTVYAALFDAAAATLKRFGRNHGLPIDMGLCAVLHTHARNLDFHPHVHVIVRVAVSIKSGVNGASSRAGICSTAGRWPRCFGPSCWMP